MRWSVGWLSIVVFSQGLCAQPEKGSATWLDGSPILPFQEREDVSLVRVADWEGLPERHWAGPAIWTNRLQDWLVRDDSLQCCPREAVHCRTAHLLTYELGNSTEPFHLEVVLSAPADFEESGFAGLLLGAGEGRLDYRAAALVHDHPGHGGGILAVLDTYGDGTLSFREMGRPETWRDYPLVPGQHAPTATQTSLEGRKIILDLTGLPRDGDKYDLRLSAWDFNKGDLLAAQELRGIAEARLRGNIALVAHPAGGDADFAFESLRLGGGRIVHQPERAFGPIAGTLYSLSAGTLKLGAQFVHLGEAVWPDGRRLTAHLEARPLPDSPSEEEEAGWTLLDGPKAISIPDYSVLFRVEAWDSSRDWETRVVFEEVGGETSTYPTLVRREPVEKDKVSLAAFTGMGVMGRTANMGGPETQPGEKAVGRWTPANVWFPFADAVKSLQEQDPDILFFTGDQIYEHKPSPKDRSRNPHEDYLYKWLLWHWAFRDLTNHTPAVVQPDDHDVYHGNLWGWGGRLCLTGKNWDGGYLCSPHFVNLVHRTQTGHNPDPYDSRLVGADITNHYSGFAYGGVGFAVLEDRKFKTPPKIQDPEEQILLGARQLQFLKEWGEDWRDQKFKVVVSQTIYASMHVNFEAEIAKDADTNGFPKAGRDRAVELFRRCGALVVSGDQHLGTLGRLGVEQPSDAVYQLCVPAMGNIFWRWFYPNVAGTDRGANEPSYLGEFMDPWGNYFRMIAVANPERRDLLKQKLRQRYVIPESEAEKGKGNELRTCLGDGYGVVRFDKKGRTITIECWPHNADPAGGGKQFPGWPVTLRFEDLDGRQPLAWLPDLVIDGPADPVVQIIDEKKGEIVKITRAAEHFYRPGVFERDTTYTLRVGEPGVTPQRWEAASLRPEREPGASTLKVNLNP